MVKHLLSRAVLSENGPDSIIEKKVSDSPVTADPLDPIVVKGFPFYDVVAASLK